MKIDRPITAILFDLGGTLDADGVPWMSRFFDLYQQEGLRLTAQDFAPRFYAADDALVGNLPADTGLRATVARLVDKLENELPSGAPGRGERVAQSFLGSANAVLSRNLDTLATLAGGYALGIVSNFYGNLDGVCRETGLAEVMSATADSTVVGAEKPDREIFMAALRPLGVAPQNCLFVGDSLRRDKAGADSLGIPFVWVAAENAQSTPEQDDFPAIASVPEIAHLLEACGYRP